jgi:hypothetical protein
MGYSSKEGGL